MAAPATAGSGSEPRILTDDDIGSEYETDDSVFDPSDYDNCLPGMEAYDEAEVARRLERHEPHTSAWKPPPEYKFPDVDDLWTARRPPPGCQPCPSFFPINLQDRTEWDYYNNQKPWPFTISGPGLTHWRAGQLAPKETWINCRMCKFTDESPWNVIYIDKTRVDQPCNYWKPKLHPIYKKTKYPKNNRRFVHIEWSYHRERFGHQYRIAYRIAPYPEQLESHEPLRLKICGRAREYGNTKVFTVLHDESALPPPEEEGSTEDLSTKTAIEEVDPYDCDPRVVQSEVDWAATQQTEAFMANNYLNTYEADFLFSMT